MTPPRSLSIVHTTVAFVAIITTSLVIFLWPAQQENVPTEKTSESMTSSTSSSDAVLASSAPSSNSSDAFDIASSSASTPVIKQSLQRTYENTATGISFSYADDMTVSAPTSFVVEEGEIGYQINGPSHIGELWVVLSPDRTQKSNGAVRIEEVYSAPGGNLSKNYTLYTGTYKVSVFAHYDLFSLYEHQLQSGGNQSISELVKRDLGGNTGSAIKNPIERLMKRYPNERTLIDFYYNADSIVASIKTVQ